MNKLSVGVLGATGTVGQRFIQLLENHPWFDLVELAASEKSSGKTYAEAMSGRWKISSEIPHYAKGLEVKECKPDLDCELVFSALDANAAEQIEKEFAKNGYAVSSNTKTHRMDADVPLLVPEINAGHLQLIKTQKENRKWNGFIVTNPNCSTIQMNIALKPLYDSFGLDKVMVTTMQAISGAGYPGVASLDILDNVVPFIGGEEEKMQTETLKILGTVNENKIKNASFSVSANCNRVHVNDGHLECVNVKLSRKAEIEDFMDALNDFNPLKELNLPSSPEKPIVVFADDARPQPKLDRMLGNGMSVSVGRIRQCPILDYKFLVLGHNTIRGAAGAAILNAELMKAKGYLDR